MSINAMQVAEQVLSDLDQTVLARCAPQGDLIVSQLHGGYFENNRKGNLYMWSSGAAGVTVTKYDSTTPAFVLWNKSLTNNLELVELTISWVGTPGVAGNFGLSRIVGAGQAVGTPISAFTELATAWKMKTLASANPPNGKCATTSTIAALAATDYMPLGFSMPDALAAASTTVPGFVFIKQFRGDLIVSPGNAIALMGNVAQTQE